jgi:hypothetical protein
MIAAMLLEARQACQDGDSTVEVCLVCLVYLVCPVLWFVHPNTQDRPNRPDRPDEQAWLAGLFIILLSCCLL